MLNIDNRGAVTIEFLSELVYELLDAQGDTILLGAPLEEELAWAAHLDYLRGLQRVGREALARVAPGAAV